MARLMQMGSRKKKSEAKKKKVAAKSTSLFSGKIVKKAKGRTTKKKDPPPKVALVAGRVPEEKEKLSTGPSSCATTSRRPQTRSSGQGIKQRSTNRPKVSAGKTTGSGGENSKGAAEARTSISSPRKRMAKEPEILPGTEINPLGLEDEEELEGLTEDVEEKLPQEPGKKAKKEKKPWVRPNWEVSTYALPFEHFRDVCKLPGTGLLPAKISSEMVPDSVLEETFGKKVGKNGYPIKTCSLISEEDICHLVLICNGFLEPVNERLGKREAKGFYAERILGERVNWAAFAANKHEGQLRFRWRMGAKAPTGPPHIRDHHVYIPPLGLKFKDGSPASLNETEPAEVGAGFSSPKMPVPASDRETPHGSSTAIQSPNYPLSSKDNLDVLIVKVLKDAVAASKKMSETLIEEGHDLENNLAAIAHHRKDVLQIVEDTTKLMKHDASDHQRLKDAIALLMVEKEGLENEIDAANDGDDSDNEEGDTLKSIEVKLEEVDAQIAKLEEDAKTTQHCGKEWQEEHRKAMAQLVEIAAHNDKIKRLKDLNADKLAEITCTLQNQKAELEILTKHFDKNRTVLLPRHIFTSADVRRPTWRVSLCPVCVLGFHCENFMPTPCGHSYHPACILPLLSAPDKPPSCVACQEVFHPDWLESWGVTSQFPGFADKSEELGLASQRLAHEQIVKDMYNKGSALLASKRDEEQTGWKSRTFKYTKEQVENDMLMSKVARKRATLSAQMTLTEAKFAYSERSGLSVGEGMETITVEVSDDSGGPRRRFGELLQPKIEGELPKGAKKRKSEESIGRKVSTRNATKLELATSDASPTENPEVTLKSLNKVKTPGAGRGRGMLLNSSNTDSAKSSGKGSSSRRKLPMSSS